MKRILILHTGGTIAMHEDTDTGKVTTDQMNPLLNFQSPFEEEIELVIEDFFNIPSPHITPVHMLALKERIQLGIEEKFDGVVITHGTDTIEETAYFLDLTIGQQLPIVLTGAMRSSNEVGSDGLYNFISAIRVAAEDESRHKGTLVVMNDEIHTAKYVTKTHTTNVATFRTPTFGPIGLVSKSKIMFFQELMPTKDTNVQSVYGTIPIVKAFAGMDGSLFDLLSDTPIDGLVIEALGAGNLPPQTLPAIEKLLAKNIPLVLVSRCFNGVAEGVYDYSGGGKQLLDLGILFCTSLNSQKARLKLLVALNRDLNENELRAFISG